MTKRIRRSNAPPRMSSTTPPPPVARVSTPARAVSDPSVLPDMRMRPPPALMDERERLEALTPSVPPVREIEQSRQSPDTEPHEDDVVPPSDGLATEFFDRASDENAATDLEHEHEHDEHGQQHAEDAGSPGPDAERRARFAKFVRLTVAVCAVLCLLAVVRGMFARHADPAPPVAELKAPPPVAEPAEPEPALQATPVLDFDAAIAAEPAGAKRESLIALEARRLPEAIAAGERAVEFDSADGEAWLILGAAYQESGKLIEARRCYRTCVVKGKVDPRGECAAMLR